MKGIDNCSYEEFLCSLRVGVAAPFYLTKLFLPHFAPGAAIVNISSTREFMSQPQTESYSAAKGGIGALTHALATSLAGRVRVNAIAPGWIDTAGASIPRAGWATPWTSPTWRCSCAPKRRALSPAKPS